MNNNSIGTKDIVIGVVCSNHAKKIEQFDKYCSDFQFFTDLEVNPFCWIIKHGGGSGVRICYHFITLSDDKPFNAQCCLQLNAVIFPDSNLSERARGYACSRVGRRVIEWQR